MVLRKYRLDVILGLIFIIGSNFTNYKNVNRLILFTTVFKSL